VAAIAPQASSPALSPGQIVALAQARQREYAWRDSWYDRLRGYYFDAGSGAGRGYDPPILAMNSQGRPLLRPFEVGGSIESKRSYSSKRLAPIIDDYMAIKGKMPATRVPPPKGEQGEEKAMLLTQYLYSTHELSGMDRQQAEAAFNLSMLGDACYMLEPVNPNHRPGRPSPHSWRVVWTVVNPRSAYPSFYRGYKRFMVYDLVTIQEWSVYDLNVTFKDFGVRVSEDSDPEDRAVITYLSPYQRTTVIGTREPKRGPHIEWDLGFCPASWAYNKVPGKMGMADIQHSLNQEDFLDFLLSVMADGIVHMTYPIVGIKDANNVGTEQFQQGPGAPPVQLQSTGDIIVRSTQGDIKAAMEMVQQTLEDITSGTGSSEVRQTGQMHSSITTGRAVHAVQGPQSTRIDLWQQMMGAVIQNLNSMTLEMQERAPHLADFDEDLFGNFRGRSFQIRMSAAKDIDGWYRNTVRWESLVGMNLQQKLSVAFEGLQAKLWDRATAREMVGVDDPLEMDEHIERDMLSDARIQSDVEKIMGQQQGQGGGTPPGAPSSAPSGESASAQSGGPAPPPQPIMRPPNMLQQKMQQGGMPPPPPAPAGSSVDQFRLVLVSIAGELKGEVFAVGDLAITGSSPMPQFAITDSRDYTKVLRTVRLVNPRAKAAQKDESKLGVEAVRVA
jgi:hypothetical protein